MGALSGHTSGRKKKKKKMSMYFLYIHEEIILFVPSSVTPPVHSPASTMRVTTTAAHPGNHRLLGGDVPRPPGPHHGSAKPELLLPLGSTG